MLLDPSSQELGSAYHAYGLALRHAGRFDEAEPMVLRAIEIKRGATGPGWQREFGGALNDLANLYWRQGRNEAARPLREEVVALYRVHYTGGHPFLATALDNFAIAHAVADELDEAGKLFLEALDMRLRMLPPDHPDIGISYNNMAVQRRDVGKLDDALEYNRLAMGIRERSLGPDHPSVAWSLQNMADVLGDLGREDEARPLLERSLAIREAALGPDHPDVAESLSEIGQLAERQQRFEDAEATFRRALAINAGSLGEDSPKLAWNLNNLATSLIGQGRLDEAEVALHRASELREAGDADLASDLRSLAEIARQRGDVARAEVLLREGLDLGPKADVRTKLEAELEELSGG